VGKENHSITQGGAMKALKKENRYPKTRQTEEKKTKFRIAGSQ